MRKKRRLNYMKILVALLVLVMIISGSVTIIKLISDMSEKPQDQDYVFTPELSEQDEDKEDLSELLELSGENLYSPNAILIRLDDSKVIMDKNSNEKIYPASLTKIMTTIIAIETISDLQQSIKLPDYMFRELYEQNASMAGFLPEEKVKVIDLIYGAMLPSGAECCIGLANLVAGTEQDFIILMNEKAKQLGMENTNFSNTTGLHNSSHYTTVKDIATLLQYCLNNDTFLEVFTTQKYSTSSTNLHPGGITFNSSMFSKMDSAKLYMDEILGGKTGYTEQAGLCLASYACINDQKYILITTGAEGNTKSEQKNIYDAFEVFKGLNGE